MDRYVLGTVLLLAAGGACASDIDIVVPAPGQALAQDDFRAVSEDLGAAFNYKGLNPTEPLGITGFNVGAVGSYTPLDNEQALRDLTGEDIEALGTAGLGVTKGLPFGFDVGGFYSAVPTTDARLWGVEARYAYVVGSTLAPAIGIRGSYTQLDGVGGFDFNTTSVDLSVSKGFANFTPYLGVGQVFVSSDPDEETGLEEEEFNETKLFLGARLSLLAFNLTGEVDRTGDATSFNVRLGFGL